MNAMNRTTGHSAYQSADADPLAERYRSIRRSDPKRYDLLDMLAIESMLRFISRARSKDARALYETKVSALIGDAHCDCTDDLLMDLL